MHSGPGPHRRQVEDGDVGRAHDPAPAPASCRGAATARRAVRYGVTGSRHSWAARGQRLGVRRRRLGDEQGEQRLVLVEHVGVDPPAARGGRGGADGVCSSPTTRGSSRCANTAVRVDPVGDAGQRRGRLGRLRRQVERQRRRALRDAGVVAARIVDAHSRARYEARRRP